MSTTLTQMIRASKLDASLYEEVEANPSALTPAMLVVVLSSIAAGIGSIAEGGARGILFGTASALIGWFFWSFLTYYIGTKLLPEPQTEADFGQLLRTIGFSSAPGVLRVFGIIPVLGIITFIITGIWMLIAMVIAVRQALDYTSTVRAVAVCVVGWIIQVLFLSLIFLLAR